MILGRNLFTWFTSVLLGAIAMIVIAPNGFACSTYKVTMGSKTMHGVNYDTWFTKPRIWFETNGYGTAFTGANYMGADGFTPQSGMNIHGLSFATLATITPENGRPSPDKKQITSRARFLKDVLHKCKTVDEAKSFIEEYDHSRLSKDVFLYVDKSGRYLIVEPYTCTLGNDNRYVLANFCPSTVSDFSTIKQQRFVNGSTFLRNKIDTSIAFCTALSDTMHVCRKKIGDGTLLTSIWDPNGGAVDLFFYHDYKNRVHFNLQNELAKGDHSLEIPALFQPNEEFAALVNFKTPMTSPAVDWILRIFVVLFFISAMYFLGSFLFNRREKYAWYKLAISLLSLILMFYMVALAREINIYYFPAPYQDHTFSILNIAAYIPFLVLILFIPMLWVNRKVLVENAWQFVSRWLFAVNNLSYLILIFLFAYWGLFNVFS